MSRKVATLILLVVVALSVVIVEFFFREADDPNDTVPVTGIYITEEFYDGTNPAKIAKIDTEDEIEAGMVIFEVELDPGEKEFTFYYKIEPDAATNKSVSLTINKEEQSYVSAPNKPTGGTVTVKFTQTNPQGGIYIPPDGIKLTLLCLDGNKLFVDVLLKDKDAESGGIDF